MILQELEDELEAIGAIYPGSVDHSGDEVLVEVPNRPNLRLHLQFPQDYPSAPPTLTRVDTKDPLKYPDPRYVEELVRGVLNRVFVPNDVVVFELLTELEPVLEDYDKNRPQQPKPQKPQKPQIPKENQKQKVIPAPVQQTPSFDPLEGWIQSQPVVDRGLTFVGFCRPVTSVESAQRTVDRLVLDRKVARASHNITAWRINGDNGVVFQDYDDDGESAAGSRILHLLQMMDAWNVVVVVSRWFGGVHIGPDRFKHINSVAREAVVAVNSEQQRTK